MEIEIHLVSSALILFYFALSPGQIYIIRSISVLTALGEFFHPRENSPQMQKSLQSSGKI